MSTQEIIDSHNWTDFVAPSDFQVPFNRQYFQCKICGIITFSDHMNKSYYYSLSDFNWDYHFKINTHDNKTIDLTCDEMIIRNIIE